MPSGLPMFAPLLVLLIVLWEWCLANADASSIKNTAADIHALDGNFVEHYVHCEKVSRRLIFFNDKNERIPQLYILVCLHIYFNTRVAFCLHFLSLMCIMDCNPACQWLYRAHGSQSAITVTTGIITAIWFCQLTHCCPIIVKWTDATLYLLLSSWQN